jgi:hypothetical protein
MRVSTHTNSTWVRSPPGAADGRPSDHPYRSSVWNHGHGRRRLPGGGGCGVLGGSLRLAKDLTQERFPEISGLTQSAGSSEVAAMRR